MFKPHGKATAKFDPAGIVRIDVEGPWNLELVDEVHDAIANNGEIDLDRPWVMLVVVTQSTLFGWDALQKMQELTRNQATKGGRIATAWVLAPEVEGESLYQDTIRKIYKGVQPMDIFPTVELALHWLRQFLWSGQGRSM